MRGGVFLSNAEERDPHKSVYGNPRDIALFLFVGPSSYLSLSPPQIGDPC